MSKVSYEKLILMYKDFEVLSFKVDYVHRKIEILEKLEHFDKAPYGVNCINDADARLFEFFNARAIAQQRADYEKIIKSR